MTTRETAVAAFLSRAGWAGAIRTPLTGDASARRYERLRCDPRGALLMDAPPESGEEVRRFLAIADLLSECGLSVPRILAEEAEAGLLVIEDFGDDVFTRLVTEEPTREPDLYAAAAGALAHLHPTPPPLHLPPGRRRMPEQAALVLDWYAPEARAARDDLLAIVGDAIDRLPPVPDTIVHRDFHAENLIWLARRDGVRRVGLLDFQDAMAGPMDYDLASLVGDPRRRVSDGARDAAIAAYADASGRDATDVETGMVICSAQRNLRILGIFTRLCLRDGKTRYPGFLPRTWEILTRDLGHPALADLGAFVERHLRPPTPARLDTIRTQAGKFRDRDSAEIPS